MCKVFYRNTCNAFTLATVSAVSGHTGQVQVQVREIVWVAANAPLTAGTEKACRQRVSWSSD